MDGTKSVPTFVLVLTNSFRFLIKYTREREREKEKEGARSQNTNLTANTCYPTLKPRLYRWIRTFCQFNLVGSFSFFISCYYIIHFMIFHMIGLDWIANANANATLYSLGSLVFDSPGEASSKRILFSLYSLCVLCFFIN